MPIQADDWLTTLTAPIEIPVDFVEGKSVDFNEMSVGPYTGTIENESGKASIVRYDGQNVLQVNSGSNVSIIEDFDVDPKAKYTITFWAKGSRSDKDVNFNVPSLLGNNVEGTAIQRNMGSEGRQVVQNLLLSPKALTTCNRWFLQNREWSEWLYPYSESTGGLLS